MPLLSDVKQLPNLLEWLFALGMIFLLLLFSVLAFQLITLVLLIRGDRKEKPLTEKRPIVAKRKKSVKGKKTKGQLKKVCPHLWVQHYPSLEPVVMVEISPNRPLRGARQIVAAARPN